MSPSRKKSSEVTKIPTIIDREPPKSIEAERYVLGAILFNAEVFKDVFEVFGYKTEGLFYYTPHQIIFDAMVEIQEKEKPDIHAVISCLEAKKQLTDVGGASYLSELMSSVTTSGNVIYYASIVLEMALLRRLIEQCSHIIGEAYNAQTSVKELIDKAESEIFTIATQKKVSPIYPFKEIVIPTVQELFNRIKRNEIITGIPTGFEILDSYLCGLQPSDMIVLAARPSVGKTAFALNIAKNVATQCDENGNPYGVLIFSLEMAKEQLIQRFICMLGKINGQILRNSSMAKRLEPNIVEAAGRLAGTNIYVDDTPSINIVELRSKARRHLLKHPDVKLIIIDYLQLMGVARRGENRQVEIAEISRQIKGLARELRIPVLTLCQLSREAEKDATMPKLSHLRESGAIEQDADVVLLLHYGKQEKKSEKEKEKEREKEKPKDPIFVQLDIAKQRNGPIGSIHFSFIRKYQTFTEITNVEETGAQSSSYIHDDDDVYFEETGHPLLS